MIKQIIFMCNLCSLKHYLRYRPPVVPQEVPEGVEELDVGLDRPVPRLPDDVARAAGELGGGFNSKLFPIE